MDSVIVGYASEIESGLYSVSNKIAYFSLELSYKLSKIPETLKFSS